MLTRKTDWTHHSHQDSAIPFPVDAEGRPTTNVQRPPTGPSPDELLEVMESMSRKIDDLAREFNCLGHFSDDDDGPRAA